MGFLRIERNVQVFDQFVRSCGSGRCESEVLWFWRVLIPDEGHPVFKTFKFLRICRTFVKILKKTLVYRVAVFSTMRIWQSRSCTVTENQVLPCGALDKHFT